MSATGMNKYSFFRVFSWIILSSFEYYVFDIFLSQTTILANMNAYFRSTQIKQLIASAWRRQNAVLAEHPCGLFITCFSWQPKTFYKLPLTFSMFYKRIFNKVTHIRKNSPDVSRKGGIQSQWDFVPGKLRWAILKQLANYRWNPFFARQKISQIALGQISRLSVFYALSGVIAHSSGTNVFSKSKRVKHDFIRHFHKLHSNLILKPSFSF